MEATVKKEITLQVGEQRRLQKAVAIKVYELDANILDQRNRFKQIYSEVKKQFGVDSYKEIKRGNLQEAIRYIESWHPGKDS